LRAHQPFQSCAAYLLASEAIFLIEPNAGGTVRLRLLTASLAIAFMIAIPACKHKQSSDSQEKSAALPATPPQNPPTPPPTDNSAVQPQTPPTAPAPPQPIVVAAGTTLTVKLSDDLGSKLSQTGQVFSATLDKDVIVDAQTAIPAGSNISGKVVNAHPYGKFAGEANLTLRLTSININNIDQTVVTSARSFGPKIKAQGKVHKFIGGLVKRAEGDEKDVVLAAQSDYTFSLKQPLEIQ
jgi:hypothetical protein